MTSLRDERAAVLRRWNRDLSDNFAAVLPRVLDDLDAIDGRQPGAFKPVAADLSEEELAGLRARWRAISEAEQAEQPAGALTPDEAALLDRETGRTRQAAADLLPPAEQPAAPATPATRRRTRT